METIDRFLRMVNKTNSCWIWTGYKNPKGYGKMTVNYKPLMAHRWSYEYFIGEIPPGLVIDHLCENKACVNPEHLQPVTNKENLNRGRVGQKNADHHRSKTHCRRGHEYTQENTNYLNRKTRGVLTRQCRICYSNNQAKKTTTSKEI